MEKLILNPSSNDVLNFDNTSMQENLILGIDTDEFDGNILPKVISSQNKDFIALASGINIFGFAKANNTNNTCGPASMATIMNFYGFGWSDINIDTDGYYKNEPYVRRIMEWSGAPDALFGLWGTTPMRIVDTMKKLNLKANWYGNGTDKDTIAAIKNEINQNKPVFILVDYGQLNPNYKFVLDWQVAYKYDSNGIYCKVSDFRNNDRLWSYSDFQKVMQNSLPGWNRSFITVSK